MTLTSPEHAEDDDAGTQAGAESLSGHDAARPGSDDVQSYRFGSLKKLPHDTAGRETEAFDTVVAEHESAMLRYARQQLGQGYEGRHQDAQDIVQEALLRLHRQWRQAGRSGVKNVRAWLLRVTHNLVIDAIRKRGRQRTMKLKLQQDALDTSHETAGELNGLDTLTTKEATGHAMRLLNELPDTQQRVLMLRLNDLTVRQIAEVQDMSPGNVGYHMNQALMTIARQLKQAGVV
jgi:RNA polymerase sigma factor (sigma-70 family)